jgi:hypothetical protein
MIKDMSTLEGIGGEGRRRIRMCRIQDGLLSTYGMQLRPSYLLDLVSIV